MKPYLSRAHLVREFSSRFLSDWYIVPRTISCVHAHDSKLAKGQY